jgi:hypothetical protein
VKKKNAVAVPKLRPCDWCQGKGFHTRWGSCQSKPKKKPCDSCDGKGSVPEFTADDKRNFQSACRSTFNAIAGDLPDAEHMPLSHIVEVTLDASYMDMYGGAQRFGLKAGQNDRAVFMKRMRQIRFSSIAQRWAREALR